jgi:hypothetical protein
MGRRNHSIETPTVTVPDAPVIETEQKKRTKTKKVTPEEGESEDVPVKEKKVRKKKVIDPDAPKKIRKPNAWLAHVKAYREKNPAVAYNDVLKLAKSTYKKAEAKPE